MFSLLEQIEGVKPFPVKHARAVNLLSDKERTPPVTQSTAVCRKKQTEESEKKLLAVMDHKYRKVAEISELSGVSINATRRALKRLKHKNLVNVKHINQAVGWAIQNNRSECEQP